MFNFFLLFLGFFVSANIGVLRDGLKDGKLLLSTCMAVLGAMLTVIFHFLDRRNEEFVHIAEDVLEKLESDVLFLEYKGEILWPRRRSWVFGIMRTEEKPRLRQLGIFRRQAEDDKDDGESRYAHGTWLPWFQRVIILTFLAIAIVPWVSKCLL